MLTLFGGQRHGYCDGVSRRSFLRIGALGFGGLSLPGLLRAESTAGITSSHKAIINIHLGGGPSHQDMFDLKPGAPVEFRGDFNPIRTNVPGIEICEHFPLLAQRADKFAIIRSLVGSVGAHSNYQTHSGFDQRDLQGAGGRPALGSVVTRLNGSTDSGAPPFISYNGGEPGYLGASCRPYKPDGSARQNMELMKDLTGARMDDRVSLLESLDRLNRAADVSGSMDAMDEFTRKAVEVVSSGRLSGALDVNKEPADMQQRYGREGRNFLLARRLVEAGVRVVTFNWGGWDTHGQNFTKLKTQLPQLDTAMSALIDDLQARGLDRDVAIVMWGEFGRTPRVNRTAGRDHWPRLSMAFLACGGFRTGQAIGASTRDASAAQDRPVHFQEIHATLYRFLGVDPQTVQIHDTAGRPQYLLEHRSPIHELL